MLIVLNMLICSNIQHSYFDDFSNCEVIFFYDYFPLKKL